MISVQDLDSENQALTHTLQIGCRTYLPHWYHVEPFLIHVLGLGGKHCRSISYLPLFTKRPGKTHSPSR